METIWGLLTNVWTLAFVNKWLARVSSFAPNYDLVVMLQVLLQ